MRSTIKLRNVVGLVRQFSSQRPLRQSLAFQETVQTSNTPSPYIDHEPRLEDTGFSLVCFPDP